MTNEQLDRRAMMFLDKLRKQFSDNTIKSMIEDLMENHRNNAGLLKINSTNIFLKLINSSKIKDLEKEIITLTYIMNYLVTGNGKVSVRDIIAEASY